MSLNIDDSFDLLDSVTQLDNGAQVEGCPAAGSALRPSRNTGF